MSSAIKAKPGYVPEQLATVIEKLAQVARDLSSEIARAGLGEALGAELGANSDGDTQKALDVMADEAFAAALTGTAIRYYASEEQDRVTELNPGGDLALAIDPLDGSSNIDVNVSIGTIFAIYPAGQSAEASFLRPAREIIAGGYFVYGPSTQLVVSFGQGVIAFVLDPKT
ncbi:MAG: fructose-bisphosphatase class I, partial [Mangrovicoccus sp.]